MHPTQHSTIPRPAKRGGQASPIDATTVPCTEDDILDTIRDLAARQSSCFVSIHLLGTTLGLHTDADRAWLTRELHRLDGEGRIALGCVERPQALLAASRPWCLTNALGVPCHEVAAITPAIKVNPRYKARLENSAELLSAFCVLEAAHNEACEAGRQISASAEFGKVGALPSNATSPPPWPRAVDQSTLNPTVQQRRISQLVKESAETLFGIGSKPQTRVRVIHVEHPTSTGDAA